MKNSLVVGIIQDSPVYLDLDKSMEKALELVRKAAANGAELIVFGETWLSGYPAWLDSCEEVNYWDHEPVKEIYARTHQNSIEVPGKETAQFPPYNLTKTQLWDQSKAELLIITKNVAQAILGLFGITVAPPCHSQRPTNYHDLLETDLLEKDMPQEGSSWNN